MIPSSYLLICIIIVFTACKAQHTDFQQKYSNITKSTVVRGDTVLSLSDNIMVVYQDSKLNYWFGSWYDGLYYYNGKTIVHITNLNGTTFKRVDEIKEDAYGNLYVITNNGIFSINNHSSIQLQESVINDSIWHRTSGDLFFKNTQGTSHVYRCDGKFLHKLIFPDVVINNSIQKSSFSNPSKIIDPFGVYIIYTDSKGHVWFGTAGVGVCRFDGSILKWIHEDDVTELHNGPANGVRSVLEDKDGCFWFNSMYRYKINGVTSHSSTTWYKRMKSIGSLDGKQDGEIFEYLSSLKDSNNVIWIVTYVTGIWEVNGTTINNHLIKQDGKPIKLFYIYSDKKGTLWVGTHENGVYRFNGNDFVKFTP